MLNVAQQEIRIRGTRRRCERACIAARGVNAGEGHIRPIDIAPGSGIGAEDNRLASEVEEMPPFDQRHLVREVESVLFVIRVETAAKRVIVVDRNGWENVRLGELEA